MTPKKEKVSKGEVKKKRFVVARLNECLPELDINVADKRVGMLEALLEKYDAKPLIMVTIKGEEFLILEK